MDSRIVITRVYEGWTSVEQDMPVIQLTSDLITCSAPSQFFAMYRDDTSVKFGLEIDCRLNGLPVLKTLSFQTSGVWQSHFMGKSVNAEQLGLDAAQIDSVGLLVRVFDAVHGSKACRGYPVDDSCFKTKPHCFALEQWQSGQNPVESRYRSSTCTGIQTMFSRTDHCSSCRESFYNHHKRKNVTDNPEEDDSVIKEDQSPIDTIINLFPGAPDNMKHLLLSQRRCLLNQGKDSRCRRWGKDIKMMCLSLSNCSPASYTVLRNSGFLILPSDNLLQKYTNVLQQGPGLKDDILKWMYLNAKENNVCMSGGIVFDEMSIQEDIQMVVRGNEAEYTGFVNMGTASTDMRVLKDGKEEAKLATHILQFIFLSFDGFRWAFDYFPTDGVNACDLFLLFWKAVSKLSLLGFTVEYACMDGAICNRAFLKLHIPTNFQVPNMFNPKSLIAFLMDYSHVIKRIRNNIAANGDGAQHTRKLVFSGSSIIWEHWLRAYNWDRSANPVRKHRHLTDEHMFLTKTSKMRNHLAEYVLNEDMLNLMIHFQRVLGDEGQDLAKSLELLRQTSKLVNIFRDRRAVRSVDDERLYQLVAVKDWVDSWESEVQCLNQPAAAKKAMLMTQETREDLWCILVGFKGLCERKVHRLSPR